MLTVDAGLDPVDHFEKVLATLSCYSCLSSNHDLYIHLLMDDLLVRGEYHFCGNKWLDIVSTVILVPPKRAEFYKAVVPVYIRDEELPGLTTSIVTGNAVFDEVRLED